MSERYDPHTEWDREQELDPTLPSIGELIARILDPITPVGVSYEW